ncbi:hypothetical protein ACE1OC_05095 [Streptomyces sp. DSM 116496]|uniref:hypothetical protein n=1 Tax=Streptomyces stoeckheimensis TaxID=3344656 RepID=UPI0038B3F135
MTITPSPLPQPVRALRWRAFVSWMCCVAALLLAVTVCHQSGPTPTALSTGRPATAAALSEDQVPAGSSQGCVNHQPGDACLTGLQHLPQSVQPLPDTPALPTGTATRTPAPARAGPMVRAPAPRHAVDLHSLRVLRI